MIYLQYLKVKTCFTLQLNKQLYFRIIRSKQKNFERAINLGSINIRVDKLLHGANLTSVFFC